LCLWEVSCPAEHVSAAQNIELKPRSRPLCLDNEQQRYQVKLREPAGTETAGRLAGFLTCAARVGVLDVALHGFSDEVASSFASVAATRAKVAFYEKDVNGTSTLARNEYSWTRTWYAKERWRRDI
jgi:hypothetical protein